MSLKPPAPINDDTIKRLRTDIAQAVLDYRSAVPVEPATLSALLDEVGDARIVAADLTAQHERDADTVRRMAWLMGNRRPEALLVLLNLGVRPCGHPPSDARSLARAIDRQIVTDERIAAIERQMTEPAGADEQTDMEQRA